MKKFSPTKNFNKSSIDRIPDDKSMVYKIKSASGKNLYTGIAGRHRGQERLLEHLNILKEKIPGGTKFQTLHVANKDIAEKIEKQIIKKENPEYNQQNAR